MNSERATAVKLSILVAAKKGNSKAYTLQASNILILNTTRIRIREIISRALSNS